MSLALMIVAIVAFAAWVYLVAFHGGFWLAFRFEDLPPPAADGPWPRIVAVVPARDEAGGIARCVTSILQQPYPGSLSMILIDDQSSDGTADLAARAAAAIGASDRLTVLRGQPLPSGWTGKMWAVKQGLDLAGQSNPDCVLLTDADIVYSGNAVTQLVTRMRSDNLVMASVMAQLRCESFAEKFLIPAFVFFFGMLYPFAWVRRDNRATAAAAGGCILARFDALKRAGGIESIRGALIDDCALGARLKSTGPVWLGFMHDVKSIRASDEIGDVGRMISRSAYAQLRYSLLLLLGMVVAMTVIFLSPVGLVFAADPLTRTLAAGSWVLMALAFQPTLRYYDQSPLWGVALPLIALAYMVFTLNSAYQYLRGRGGMWKGRAQANVSAS
ncbi:MAG: glycosyltransferase [Pseudomonadota bacterium]